MREIIEYKILKQPSPVDLSEAVNNECGWEPLGGAQYCGNFWIQTMVKYGKENS